MQNFLSCLIIPIINLTYYVMQYYIYLLIIVLLFTCCERESSDEVKSFPNTLELNSVPLTNIDTYFKPNVTLNVIDTFLVIANQQAPFVRVYSTNSHKELYTFGKEGRGPGEFEYAEITKQDYFHFEEGRGKKAAIVYDFKRNHFSALDIQASIEKQDDIAISMMIPSDRNHISMLHYIGLEKVISTPLSSANLLYYDIDDSAYNYVPFLPEVDINIKESNKNHIYRPAVFYNKTKSKTAVAPMMLGRLDFFNDEGRYLNSSVFEMDQSGESELEGELSDLRNAKYYVVDLDTLKNNIVALNINTITDKISSENQNNNLLFYDWDGNPKIKYKLDGIALKSFAVDHKHSRIYAYAPSQDYPIIMYQL